MDPLDDYYTVADLAKFTGRSASTIRKWANEGKVPYTRLGTFILFPKDRIQVYLEEGTIEPVVELKRPIKRPNRPRRRKRDQHNQNHGGQCTNAE